MRWRLIDSVQAVPAYIYLVFWKSWNDVLIFEPSIRFRTTPFSSGSEVKQPPVGNKLIYVFFSSYYYIMNIIIMNIIIMSIIIIIIIVIIIYYYYYYYY